MKRMTLVLASASLTLMFLTSCGGGSGVGRPKSAVAQCPAEYSPIDLNQEESDVVSKVEWPGSPSSRPTLAEGEYEYTSMEYFLEDTSSGFKFHLGESKVDENYEVTRYCARDTASIGSLNLKMDFPSLITVSASGKTSTQTKTLTVTFTDRLGVKVSKDPQEQTDPPSKVTGDQNFESQLYEFKTSDFVFFELRLQDVSGTIHKHAVVRFRKKNP